MKKVLGALALVLALTGTAHASSVSLYAAFTAGFALDPAQSISLTSGAWHIGSIGGAVATNADLHGVLSNMTSLTIGITSQGISDGGGGIQLAGFVLTNPNLGGAASDNLTCCGASNWNNIFGSWSASGGAPGGSLTVQSLDLVPTFVSTTESTIFTGNRDAAFGGALTFRFAVQANPFLALDSGRVILTADVPSPTALPEPGTLMLIATGLAAARHRRR
jgi:hypothetical protein